MTENDVVVERVIIREPPRSWLRCGFNSDKEQLWIHASDVQIEEAKERGIAVHLLFL